MNASPLSPDLAARLAKIAGMFGSMHDGERAAAAALADRLVRGAGLSWPDIIRPAALVPSHDRAAQDDLATAIAAFVTLTQWEQRFVVSLRQQRRMTDKQRAVLAGIAEKVRSR